MKILITVPHSYCPESLTRICDTRALDAAHMLAKLFHDAGAQVTLYTNTNVLRSNFDLNRTKSRSHPWRQKLDLLILKKPSLVVDVHSFPLQHTWGGQHLLKVEILYDLKTHETSLPSWLTRVIHDQPKGLGWGLGIHNDIMDRVTELSPTTPRFLLEVNESKIFLPDQKLQQFLQTMVHDLMSHVKISNVTAPFGS